MAFIGMRNPIFAEVNARVDGSPITYKTPIVIGPAVQADVTFDTADNPDYGDDVIIDNDKGVNGYTISLETNDVCKEARAACLGWKAVSSGSPAAVTHYEVTDAPAPEGGLAYIRVKLFRGERTYEAFFFHCLQFSNSRESASTKQRQITWNHPTMEASGIGAYIDASGEAHFFDWMEFDDMDDAMDWIYDKFGATRPT